MTLDTTIELPDEAEKYTALVDTYDVIVVGGGVAGLSAGLYSSRDGFKTLILEGEYESSVEMPGGALLLTSSIENFPGFKEGTGESLVSILHDQAESFGAEIVTAKAEKAEFSTENCGLHIIHASNGTVYRAKSVILTTGAIARQLNVPGEAELYGRGVSSCATCDGFFFKDQVVAVIGGGDTAVEDALFLRRFARKVYLLPRRDDLRAQGPEAREALLLNEDPANNFHILWSSKVQALHSVDGALAEVAYEDSDGGLMVLAVDGLFVAIGRDPATSFLDGSGVELDDEGYILTEPGSTAVRGLPKGVYAAGDAVDKVFRQAITSAGRAVEASLEARNYLLTVKRLP